jgi:hypothetical protein
MLKFTQPFRVIIKGDKKKVEVEPTEGSTQHSFVSADWAKQLARKITNSKPKYHDTYEATERISVEISFGGREERENLYIIRSKSFSDSFILGQHIVSQLRPIRRAPDSVSSMSDDSGYYTSRVNQRAEQNSSMPSIGNTPATANYSSAYTPSSSYSSSTSYPSAPAYSAPAYSVSDPNQTYTSNVYSPRENAATSVSSSRPDFSSSSTGNDQYRLHSESGMSVISEATAKYSR